MRQATCGYCGIPLPASDGPGRPRRFCCRSHRQRHYETLKFQGEGVTLAAIASRSEFRCSICAGRVVMSDSGDLQPTVDHIIPVACGGANHADNLQLAHRVCNVKKRDRAGFTCDPIDSPTVLSEAVIFDY